MNFHAKEFSLLSNIESYYSHLPRECRLYEGYYTSLDDPARVVTFVMKNPLQGQNEHPFFLECGIASPFAEFINPEKVLGLWVLYSFYPASLKIPSNQTMFYAANEKELKYSKERAKEIMMTLSQGAILRAICNIVPDVRWWDVEQQQLIVNAVMSRGIDDPIACQGTEFENIVKEIVHQT